MPSAPPTLTELRRRAVLICIATTIVVSGIELGLGWYFRLISVTAEGLHTAADLADSLVAYVLIAAAARPPDREHPYGHGKYDSLAAIVEGGCVAAAAIWAMFMASRVLLGLAEAHPRPEPVTVVVMAGASVLYWFVSAYVVRLAKQTHSPAVYAEAMHLRTHVYITIGLVVGLLLSRVGQQQGWPFAPRIDALAALCLGIWLILVAWRIVHAGYRQMMDTALPPDEREQITEGLRRFSHEFVEVHAIRTRRAGTDRHIDIHLVVDAKMTVEAAHHLSHRIEAELTQALPGTRLLVHVEPAVGPALEAYLERQRVGVVHDIETSPGEREDTHHDDSRSHAP